MGRFRLINNIKIDATKDTDRVMRGAAITVAREACDIFHERTRGDVSDEKKAPKMKADFKIRPGSVKITLAVTLGKYATRRKYFADELHVTPDVQNTTGDQRRPVFYRMAQRSPGRPLEVQVPTGFLWTSIDENFNSPKRLFLYRTNELRTEFNKGKSKHNAKYLVRRVRTDIGPLDQLEWHRDEIVAHVESRLGSFFKDIQFFS